MKRLLKRLYRKLKGISPPVYNLGAGQLSGRPKKALLSYITQPFRLPPNHPGNIRFSNNGIARGIVRALNELGYAVDVAEWQDRKFRPVNAYDVFIGHGGCNFESVSRFLPVSIPRIYFSTGSYWRFANDRAELRLKALEQRRGVKLLPERLNSKAEEWANEQADAIICLGNRHVRETYSRFPNVYYLNNAAYPDARQLVPRDFSAARRNFLFFAGLGNVHKGLDLLLEAFSRSKAHLYVCQEIGRKFGAVYSRELRDCPNIHLAGATEMRSPQFYRLIDKCAFAIHPSCAEGQPGSVLECMLHGLIPVLSRESNIDTDDYGVTLKDCSVEEILRTVNDLAGRPPEWCAEMSRKAGMAVARFSEAAFVRNMKEILWAISGGSRVAA